MTASFRRDLCPPAASTTSTAWYRAVDLLAATPLVVWLVLGVLVSLPQLAGDVTGASAHRTLLDGLASSARLIFSVLLLFFLFTRKLPCRAAEGFGRSLLACLAAVAPFAIVVLPRAHLSPLAFQISLALMLVGTVASVASLWSLGRSFSVLPQARGLVVTGPYRFVRHPLYLAETITILGLSFQFVQPWSAALLVATLALQLVRMRYEEQVLRDAFPDYEQYAANTPRLLPGIY